MALFSGRRRDPTWSWTVVGVIALLGVIHAIDVLSGAHLAYVWALMPGELIAAARELPAHPSDLSAWRALSTLLTYSLVHADVMHVAFNCAYFYFFGMLLAQLVGGRMVLAALVICSITAGLAFVIHHGESSPSFVVGASGAISGVAGMFVLLAFRWEDAPLVYAWPLARPVAPAQAAIVAALSAASDVYVLHSGGDGGIAVDAHVGGFAGGLVLGALMTTFFATWNAYLTSPLGRSKRRA
ncbi:MAG: rhomboid family intramembrane serine protease [Sandaracinaceae bacterium]